MKRAILILFFPFILKSQIPLDKVLHVWAGFGVSVSFTGLFYPEFRKPYRLIPVSLFVSLGVGYLKERYDARYRTGFNLSDLEHTAWGGLCAEPINCFITRNLRKDIQIDSLLDLSDSLKIEILECRTIKIKPYISTIDSCKTQ